MKNLTIYLLFILTLVACSNSTTNQPQATRTPEPIVPTATPRDATEVALELLTPSPTPEPTEIVAQETPSPIPEQTAEPTATPVYPESALINSDEMKRFGVAGSEESHVVLSNQLGLPYSLYIDWWFQQGKGLVEGVEYYRMVRLNENELLSDLNEVIEVAIEYPGSSWIIGNEPDVRWQDNTNPERYAEIYYEVRTAILEVDPTAQFATAGIAEGTPLRLQYLDRVLAHYEAEYGEKLPTDFWTLHAYVLPEVRDSWGVDIPPGFEDVNEGKIYDIPDHANLEYFAEGIINFRTWMLDNGYQDQELLITEFGILLPTDYGFPPEFVQQYMIDTFDILLSLEDDEIGLASDNGRLVQAWTWFLLYERQDGYNTGNLVDVPTGELTPIGETMKAYLTEARE